MTPEGYRQVVTLFEATRAQPPEARAAFLRAAAGEDAELHQAVRAMLSQDERLSLLHTAGGAAPALMAAQVLRGGGPEALPERIGEYRIRGVLGVGAMGTVYRAEQQRPRREVALKTIHWWMLSPVAVERFRFEAQALAQLQHPGIPQVYTVCESTEGISFAMELVEGMPLSAHVARLGGDVRAVLALLADIADAVHHAHLRGLVHRDLKPDNVRVTASGQPKVLDFGISLPVDVSGGAAPVSEVSGTLAYMSPEQLWPARGIDIRADVYALGLMAYELLCGEHPFALAGLDFEQARERICQAPVVPLSMRRPELRGDVSFIVARAMARRREERYDSAADFAADLRRHLRCEPVRAHPGGVGYRLGRRLRRHRVAAALGTLSLAALCADGGTHFILYRESEAACQRRVPPRTEDGPRRVPGRDAPVREALDTARPEGEALTAGVATAASTR